MNDADILKAWLAESRERCEAMIHIGIPALTFLQRYDALAPLMEPGSPHADALNRIAEDRGIDVALNTITLLTIDCLEDMQNEGTPERTTT